MKVKTVSLEDFTCIDPHPYGIWPEGNACLAGAQSFEKQLNASFRSQLSDDIWQQILSYCNGHDLGRWVQTCRICYATGHQPELWRDLVLQRFHGHTLNCFADSWKDTFVAMATKGTKRQRILQRSHVPMAMSGIYSDTYYRSHLCRSFAIPQLWLNPIASCRGIDRIPYEGISMDNFRQRYEERNRPVVLVGAAKKWKAFQNWNQNSYLSEKCGDRGFRATSGAAPLAAQFTLEAYLDYCKSNKELMEEAPLYLFDRTALLDGSSLKDDYYSDLQRSCPFFDPARSDENGHDLFAYLGDDDKRPDHTWIIMGPKRSGSSFHIDPNATHAWNAAIVGRKRWIFYPPGVTPPGVHPSPNGADVAMPISIGEWILQFWEEHLERCCSGPIAQRPLECTVEPGDVIFVPHGWWHSVINLDDVNIAITHNFVNRSNLPTVLRFLRHKEDQISGCRDRAETIKPEQLSQAFESALRARHSSWYEEANRSAEAGWSCPAWTDSENSVLDGSHVKGKVEVEENPSRIGRKRKTSGNFEGNSIMSKAKLAGQMDANSENSIGGFSFSFI